MSKHAWMALAGTALLLAACGQTGLPVDKRWAEAHGAKAEPAMVAEAAPAQAAVVAPVARPTALGAAGAAPEALDTATEAERAAASAAAEPAQGAQKLGTTIASLGDPTDTGFWIKTPLAKAPGKGRIVDPGTGKAVNVNLIPMGGDPGAGSQVSLSALRELGVNLTALPEIEVWTL